MSRDGANDCITVTAQINTNQKINVYVMKDEEIATVMEDMDNNTRIALQQTSDKSCDIDIIIHGTVTASLQGEFDEESFKMISTSPENNFNINPITVEDGL